MRTIIFMRHAKSDWSHPGLSDHDRPLNARGLRSAPLVAGQLKEKRLAVDVILASSATRVQQTVSLLQQTWSTHTDVLTETDLYLASPEHLKRRILGLHDSWNSVMFVAHNPGLETIVSQLSGRPTEFPTAAVAVFTSECEAWPDIFDRPQLQLVHLWKPREIEGTA